MCNQKRGAKNQRREQSDSGRVGLRPQSEREPAVPKRGARERKIPRAIFLCFFFLFISIPEKMQSLKVFRHGGERADRSLPWFNQRDRQPHNQLRLFVGYGPSERLRLLVGHALIHKCTHDIEITTNIHLQTCASWRHVNQPETLPTY